MGGRFGKYGDAKRKTQIRKIRLREKNQKSGVEKSGVASTLLTQMEVGWRAGRWEEKNYDDMNRFDK